MSDVQPPLNRPTDAQSSQWEGWSEREMLIAILIRINALAGIMVKMADDIPQIMRQPMIKAAMRLLIRQDKSNEQSST